MINSNLYRCKGYCETCGEPKGFIPTSQDKIFCYKCNNFKKLPYSTIIGKCEQYLEKDRLEFRNLVVNGNIKRYLMAFASLGEVLVKLPGVKFSHRIPLNDEIPVNFDLRNLVLSTIGLNWLLEDLNYQVQKTSDYQLSTALNLVLDWINKFRSKIYFENNLGTIIKNAEGVEKYYFYEKLKFYDNSLKEFGVIDPEETTEKDIINIYEKMINEERDSKIPKEIIIKRFFLTLINGCYLQYPNINDKIFSFEDILYDDTIPKIISIISDFYDDKRNLLEKERNEEVFFLIGSIHSLKRDLKKLPWNRLLELFIISSKSNPMSFPLVISYENEVIITPSRLKFAQRMMEEKLEHKSIHELLSDFSGKSFQEQVEEILIKKGIIIIDPINHETWNNIKKKDGFEIDIFGIYKKYILIVECKSFHPHPFFKLKNHEDSLKRINKIRRFHSQFESKIKPWLLKQTNENPKRYFIKIECSKQDLNDQKKSKKYTLNLPKKYQNIESDNIIGLYITQLDECFDIKLSINQVYFKDIEMFFENLIPDLG